MMDIERLKGSINNLRWAKFIAIIFLAKGVLMILAILIGIIVLIPLSVGVISRVETAARMFILIFLLLIGIPFLIFAAAMIILHLRTGSSLLEASKDLSRFKDTGDTDYAYIGMEKLSSFIKFHGWITLINMILWIINIVISTFISAALQAFLSSVGNMQNL